MAGEIIADMTFLKDEGLIKPEPPSQYSTYSGPKVPYHWEVSFELVMIVDGRNLRYEARWPPRPPSEDGESRVRVQNQRVHAKGQTSIAAAFKPGTA